jgi:hypothetical protein
MTAIHVPQRLRLRWRRPQAEAVARGENPYGETDGQSVEDALAALPPEQPTFTPAPPKVTGAIPVLSDAQAVLREDNRTADAADLSVLAAVLSGLRNLDRPRRAETFRRDFTDLPLFRQVAKSAGWAGLHAEQPAPRLHRMTADRWHAAEMARIGHVTEVAQAEIRARAAYVDGVERHNRSVADGAPMFGRAA